MVKNMPLVDALIQYIMESPQAFHMPGHKGGQGLSSEFKNLISKMDVTEVPGLDNLHAPSGVIADAQHLAAEAFKSEACFFLVNGSTSGIHAMIHTACGPGDQIIVPRNSHKSVWDALVLSGAHPVYIQPVINDEQQLVCQVTPQQVREALRNHPDTVGMILLHPNYYGLCADIKAIRDILTEDKKMLLVDEAHGAHFIYNAKLPVSSGEVGADIWVQSAHKTLPALTQSAYLHTKGSIVDKERLAEICRIFQTTSPSYLLMASLDWARHCMETEGSERLDALLYTLKETRESLHELGIATVDGYTDSGEVFTHDPTRLVLDVSTLGLNGYQAETLLRKSGIQVEMSDLRRVVLICTIADSKVSYEKLLHACSDLARIKGPKIKGDFLSISREIPEQILSPRDAFNSAREYIPLKNASGRISAGLISVYPPGVPRYCPGELIDDQGVNELLDVVAAGGKIVGLLNNGLIPIVDIKE